MAQSSDSDIHSSRRFSDAGADRDWTGGLERFAQPPDSNYSTSGSDSERRQGAHAHAHTHTERDRDRDRKGSGDNGFSASFFAAQTHASFSDSFSDHDFPLDRDAHEL